MAWLSALTLLHGGMSVLLLPLYVAALSPADFGVLAVVNVVAAVFGAMANLKLDGAMRALHFEHEGDVHASRRYLRLTFTGALVAGAATCTVMMALGEPLFTALFANDVEFFPAGALAVTTATINACLAVYFTYLRNCVALRELVRWQALIVLGTLACQSFFVLLLHLGLVGVLWGSLVPAAFTLLVVCAVTPDLLDARLEWRRLLPSLRYSVPLVALSSAFLLTTRLDRLVLERYLSLEALGAYALLLGVLGIQAIVLIALDGAVRPHLFAEIKAQGARAQTAIERYQRLFCVAGLLALSVAVCIGANVQLVTDQQGYLAMQRWLPLGAIAFVPTVLSRYYSLLHESQRRSLSLTIGVVTRLAVSFALVVVLVPRFGVGGALGALLAAETLTAALLRHSAARGLEAPPSLRAIAAPIALFAAGLWISARAAGDSMAAFGVLQLCVVVSLLVATNHRTLWMLRRDARVAPPAGSGS